MSPPDSASGIWGGLVMTYRLNFGELPSTVLVARYDDSQL